jgi:hypothetical protein
VLHTPCLVIKAVVNAADSQTREVVGAPAVTPHRGSGGSVRERVSLVAARIPIGSWTTYGDIAAKIGVHARNVANSFGRWPGFAWRDGRTDDPIDVLKDEGIRFANGRADPAQRWHPPDDPVSR